jgi:hypothetical protein|tara:strand:- start:1595 stop:2572 length:978 start_codon:yes stop_codon:yes gene_type:complete
MYKFTNKNQLSLPLAVFLVNDTYDYDSRDTAISTTAMLRSVRSIILSMQHDTLEKEVDIIDLAASKLGTAFHDACESAWKNPEALKIALTAIGKEDWQNRIKINSKVLSKEDIPVYIEQRHEKKLGEYTITGKYDVVVNGRLSDYKSTSVYSVIFGSNDQKYILQGSIYRWLSPNIITDDYMDIEFIFTDWSKAKALQQRDYPQNRVMTKTYPLMSLEATEQWLTTKLQTIQAYLNADQEALPECTDEELWATSTVFKYYKNPSKLDRSTKNFDTLGAANARLTIEGSVGVVKEVRGQVKACTYCNALNVCNQAKQLIMQGRLLV